MRPKVVMVDDEEGFLLNTKFEFKRDFDFICFTNPHDAIAALENGLVVDVILSDQKMNEMSGTEFLKITSERWPDIERIMMTGFSDNMKLLECINEAGLSGFLKKPLIPSQVIKELTEAYEKRKTKLGLKSRVEKKTSLFEQDVKKKRTSEIIQIANIYGYGLNSTLSFISFLEALTDYSETNWADAQLYDEYYDKEMMEKFESVIDRISRYLTIGVRSEVKEVGEVFSNVGLSYEKNSPLSSIEFSVLVAAEQLIERGEETSFVSCDVSGNQFKVDIVVMGDFGRSILDLRFNRSTEEIVKNALILHLCACADLLNGRITPSVREGQYSIQVRLPHPLQPLSARAV